MKIINKLFVIILIIFTLNGYMALNNINMTKIKKLNSWTGLYTNPYTTHYSRLTIKSFEFQNKLNKKGLFKSFNEKLNYTNKEIICFYDTQYYLINTYFQYNHTIIKEYITNNTLRNKYINIICNEYLDTYECTNIKTFNDKINYANNQYEYDIVRYLEVGLLPFYFVVVSIPNYIIWVYSQLFYIITKNLPYYIWSDDGLNVIHYYIYMILVAISLIFIIILLSEYIKHDDIIIGTTYFLFTVFSFDIFLLLIIIACKYGPVADGPKKFELVYRCK